MPMGRSTFSHIKDMLSINMTGSRTRRRRRAAIPLDMQIKVAWFRLGHDGNRACKFFFFLCPATVTCAVLFVSFHRRDTGVYVFLFLTCFFFSVAVTCIANLFGWSSGSVVNCTKRFICNESRLAEDIIVWPDADRRSEFTNYAWSTFGFRGCIGPTDGTTIPLACAPSHQPWMWHCGP